MSLLTKVRIFSPLGAREAGRAEVEELEEGEVAGDFLVLVVLVLLPLIMRELPGSLPLLSSMVW